MSFYSGVKGAELDTITSRRFSEIFKKKKMKYKYTCFKCGNRFKTDIELETDKPTCDKCFKILLSIKSADEYRDFIK